LGASTVDNLGQQKTADLSLLVNETVSINSKPSQSGGGSNSNDKVQIRDDWTFDRVEYDLIEFLQDLNARYQHGNKHNKSQAPASPQEGNSEGMDLLQPGQLRAKSGESIPPAIKEPQQTAPDEDQQKAALLVEPNGLTAASTEASNQNLSGVSLASGDQDISESNWQYGIFDRFTRARPSQKPAQVHNVGSTTPDPFISAASSQLDVRSFNSDECGLRTYLPEDTLSMAPGMFPPSDLLALSEYDHNQAGGEASKELNQRRQRPSQLPFLAKVHKLQSGSQLAQDKEQSGASISGSDLVSGVFASSSGPESNDHNHQSAFSPPEVAETQAESEFNLNSRRQWLQQQLGNTLQLLGFNLTNQSASEFLNQTSGLSLNGRENMMKMSAQYTEKAAKSLGNSEQAKNADFSDKLDASQTNQRHDNEMLIKELDLLRARQDELKLEARVIGGTDARLGDSPWSVSLQALVSRPGTGGVEYRHYCGGTIISEYYILTAAHCLDFMVGRESRLFVVMGDLNWRMSASSAYGKRQGIEKLIIHSGYKSTAFGHDIGLIKTKEPIKPMRVNGRYIINSVCLPERNVEHSGEAELVGWGLFSNRNEMADSLQIADVPILPRPLCVDLYRRRTGLIQWLIGIELITEKQICAGTFGRGICQGDSGSALVFNEKVSRPTGPNGRAATTRLRVSTNRDQQSKATIIGVVAFGGIRRCSYQSLPGVYMQTSKYLDWILPRISA